MILLFVLSLGAAAITFGILYTYGVRKPVIFLTRAFKGQTGQEQGKSLQELGKVTENTTTSTVGRFIWYPLRAVLFLGETYVQAGWGAYCVLRAYQAIERAVVHPGWGYHAGAFVVCISALGYLARKEPRKDVLSTIQSCIAMGSYIVFCITPAALQTYYPWLVSYFSP